MNGARRISKERKRQIEKGHDAAHDDEHDADELACAAAYYAGAEPVLICNTSERDATYSFYSVWPWTADEAPVKHLEFETPRQIRRRVRELEKAGALCAAEIDRLLRKLARVKSELAAVPEGDVGG